MQELIEQIQKDSSFSAVLDRRLGLIRDILGKKGEEYASGSNRYHNFDVAAAMNSDTPEDALWGFMLKHIVSVKDLIEKAPFLTEDDMGIISEKIGDTINYLILLEGLFARRVAGKAIDYIIARNEELYEILNRVK